MAVVHTRTLIYKDQSSTNIQTAESITGNAEHNLDDAAVPVVTNKTYGWNVVRANLQSLAIFASGPLTIKTNSSGSPTDTISISAGSSAGQLISWSLQKDGLAKCPLSADVTAGLFVTNAGSGTVAMSIRAVSID